MHKGTRKSRLSVQKIKSRDDSQLPSVESPSIPRSSRSKTRVSQIRPRSLSHEFAKPIDEPQPELISPFQIAVFNSEKEGKSGSEEALKLLKDFPSDESILRFIMRVLVLKEDLVPKNQAETIIIELTNSSRLAQVLVTIVNEPDRSQLCSLGLRCLWLSVAKEKSKLTSLTPAEIVSTLGTQFADLVQGAVGGPRLTENIVLNLLTLLVLPSEAAALDTKYELTFGKIEDGIAQVVMNPSIWEAIFRSLVDSPLDVRTRSLELVSLLLVSFSANSESLSRKGWQKWIFPLLSDISLDIFDDDNQSTHQPNGWLSRGPSASSLHIPRPNLSVSLSVSTSVSHVSSFSSLSSSEEAETTDDIHGSAFSPYSPSSSASPSSEIRGREAFLSQALQTDRQSRAIYAHVLHIFATVHFRTLKDRAFGNLLRESIAQLKAYGGYSDKTQAVGNVMYNSLVCKMHDDSLFTSDISEPAWLNLVKLLHDIKRFVFMTPYWQTDNNRVDGEPGDTDSMISVNRTMTTTQLASLYKPPHSPTSSPQASISIAPSGSPSLKARGMSSASSSSIIKFSRDSPDSTPPHTPRSKTMVPYLSRLDEITLPSVSETEPLDHPHGSPRTSRTSPATTLISSSTTFASSVTYSPAPVSRILASTVQSTDSLAFSSPTSCTDSSPLSSSPLSTPRSTLRLSIPSPTSPLTPDSGSLSRPTSRSAAEMTPTTSQRLRSLTTIEEVPSNRPASRSTSSTTPELPKLRLGRTVLDSSIGAPTTPRMDSRQQSIIEAEVRSLVDKKSRTKLKLKDKARLKTGVDQARSRPHTPDSTGSDESEETTSEIVQHVATLYLAGEMSTMSKTGLHLNLSSAGFQCRDKQLAANVLSLLQFIRLDQFNPQLTPGITDDEIKVRLAFQEEVSFWEDTVLLMKLIEERKASYLDTSFLREYISAKSSKERSQVLEKSFGRLYGLTKRPHMANTYRFEITQLNKLHKDTQRYVEFDAWTRNLNFFKREAKGEYSIPSLWLSPPLISGLRLSKTNSSKLTLTFFTSILMRSDKQQRLVFASSLERDTFYRLVHSFMLQYHQPVARDKYVAMGLPPSERALAKLAQLPVNKLAEALHEAWCAKMTSLGWTKGTAVDYKKKQHPNLVPFEKLNTIGRDYNINTVNSAVGTAIDLGFVIEKKTRKGSTAQIKHSRSFSRINRRVPRSPRSKSPTGDRSPLNFTGGGSARFVKNIRPASPSTTTRPASPSTTSAGGFDADDAPRSREIPIQFLAENLHETWVEEKMRDGWRYAMHRNEKKKQDSKLVPFKYLSKTDQEVRSKMVETVFDSLRKLNYYIIAAEEDDAII